MKYLRQKKHFYALGPHSDPVLRINSGETIVVETLDNMGNRVNSENDSDQILPPINPVSGPIYIENAEKGDCLEVIIEDIKALRGHGWTGQTSEWGFIEMCSPIWNILTDTIPTVIKICKIENDKIHFPLKDGKEVILPFKPIIGTIGTAPEFEVPSGTQGSHGGNMDCLEVKPSNKLYLPIYVTGGLLFLGDVHASQGHGELGGAPVEVSAESKLTINLIKNKSIGCPRIVSEDYLMTVGSSKPTENAIRIALCELVTWLKDDYNFDIWDANLLITSVAEIECSQITNPLFTAALKFPKKYLP